MERKRIKGKGEADYDFKNDILFFKTKNREYVKSVELDNVVLDIDKEGFIAGIQIFEASKFLRLGKIALRDIPTWQFDAKVDRISKDVAKAEIRLMFNVRVRNRIIEKNPIIMPQLNEPLPNSELICKT